MITGGSWVLEAPGEVFAPEDLDEAQQLIARTVREFVENEVLPVLPAIEGHDFSQSVRLLRQAGDLGLTGIEVPEQYGGLGGSKVTAGIVLEGIGAAGSFATSFAAHTGIGTQPIVYFGSAAQKERYLPALATAETIGSYCLTESSAGSDALSGKTIARLSEDGSAWILNGAKQWITNSGFADLFIVYAKVDGEQFSAFIVERGTPGLSTGREEVKLGIKGSSTRTVTFEDCRIPVENLLHEVGKGHQIAFNILNLGRWKLAAAALGGSRQLLGIAARYAKDRIQFGKPIAAFPLIQQKLATMATRIYAAESASYRTAALLDAGLSGLDLTSGESGPAAARAIQDWAVECSIMKVLGSEVLDYVVDEALQIHGGYGYMEEFPVARAYRDSRINRIFEGTNEINRLLITGDLLRKGMRNQLPLMSALGGLQNELMTLMPPAFDGETPLEQERWLIDASRKIGLMIAGLAVQKYGVALEAEQEQLAGVADILIEIYAMESAVLRAVKHPSDLRRDLATAYVHDAFSRVETTARTLLAGLDEGDTLRTNLAILRKLTRRDPVNTIALGRRIAAQVLAANGYPLAIGG